MSSKMSCEKTGKCSCPERPCCRAKHAYDVGMTRGNPRFWHVWQSLMGGDKKAFDLIRENAPDVDGIVHRYYLWPLLQEIIPNMDGMSNIDRCVLIFNYICERAKYKPDVNTYCDDPYIVLKGVHRAECGSFSAIFMGLAMTAGVLCEIRTVYGHTLTQVWVGHHWEIFDCSFKNHIPMSVEDVAAGDIDGIITPEIYGKYVWLIRKGYRDWGKDHIPVSIERSKAKNENDTLCLLKEAPGEQQTETEDGKHPV